MNHINEYVLNWSNNDTGFTPLFNLVEVIHSNCELKLSLLKPLWKVQKLWVVLPKRNTYMQYMRLHFAKTTNEWSFRIYLRQRLLHESRQCLICMKVREKFLYMLNISIVDIIFQIVSIDDLFIQFKHLSSISSNVLLMH